MIHEMKKSCKLPGLLPVLILTAACLTLSGCGGKKTAAARADQTDGTWNGSTENASFAPSDPAEKASEDRRKILKKNAEEPAKTARKETQGLEPAAAGDTFPDHQGTFIKAGSRIYFRDYSPAGYRGSAAYGQFRVFNSLEYSPWGDPPKLSYYDEENRTIHAVSEDESIGDLVYGKDRFYLTSASEGFYQAYTVKPETDGTISRQSLTKGRVLGYSPEDGIRVLPMIWIDCDETERLEQYGIDPEELTNLYACFPSGDPEEIMYPTDHLGFYCMTYDETSPSGMAWIYGDSAQFAAHMQTMQSYGETSMLAYVYSSYRMGYVFRVEEVYVP